MKKRNSRGLRLRNEKNSETKKPHSRTENDIFFFEWKRLRATSFLCVFRCVWRARLTVNTERTRNRWKWVRSPKAKFIGEDKIKLRSTPRIAMCMRRTADSLNSASFHLRFVRSLPLFPPLWHESGATSAHREWIFIYGYVYSEYERCSINLIDFLFLSFCAISFEMHKSAKSHFLHFIRCAPLFALQCLVDDYFATGHRREHANSTAPLSLSLRHRSRFEHWFCLLCCVYLISHIKCFRFSHILNDEWLQWRQRWWPIPIFIEMNWIVRANALC